MSPSICHCGQNISFESCCKPIILRQNKPHSAEQLMRSRFTAFKLREHQYLVDTQYLAPGDIALNISDFDADTIWIGLEIIENSQSPSQSNQDEVEFVAFYKTNESSLSTKPFLQLHEKSIFFKIKEQWLYVSGQHLLDIKFPRNQSCFCNSGKKFKKCHGL